MKLSFNFLSLVFVSFSGWYVTKLPVSPVYFFYLFGLLAIAIRFSYNKKIEKSLIWPILFLFYTIITQFSKTLSAYNSAFAVLLSVSYFIITSILMAEINFRDIISISEKLIKYSIPLLCLESVLRFVFPKYGFDGVTLSNGEDLTFYKYKFNSIMYQDSNFVGIFIVTLIFFQYYLGTITQKKYMAQKYLLYVLVVLTLSRAAIVSTFIFSIIYSLLDKYSHVIRRNLFFTILFCSFSVVFLAIILGEFFSNDASFNSKFDIIQSVYFFIINKASIYQILSGIGFGETSHYIGIGAHNIVLTYLIESGFIGFVLWILLWLYLIIQSKMKLLYVVIPFLVTGMSLAGHALTFLYCIFAIIIAIEKRYDGNINEI